MPHIGHCSPRLPEETVTRLLLLILAAVTQLTRQAAIVDLDETTHTLYVPDANEGPVYILDTSTCNGSTPTCSSPILTAAQGDGVVVERAHHSVFIVQAINFSDQVQILDSITCNSTNQSGCGAPPSQSFTVGFFPFVPATVDEA